MILYITESRTVAAKELNHGNEKQTRQHISDDGLDNLIEAISDWDITFEEISNDILVAVEKPVMQKVLAVATPEKIKAYETHNEFTDGARAIRLKGIDPHRELDLWLGNLDSKDSAKSHYYRITKFLNFFWDRDIEPLLVDIEQVRVFVNWLKVKNMANNSIRGIISSCKRFLDIIFQNHGINGHNPFDAYDLRPPKKRKIPIIAPSKSDQEILLEYALAVGSIEVYTALKLTGKHAFRRGAYQNMEIAGHKLITRSKGKNFSVVLDSEDLKTWNNCPLNAFSATQLGDRVNYFLKEAYRKGMVKYQYKFHHFRHASAHEFYMATRDVLATQIRLHHSSLSSTDAYLNTLADELLIGESKKYTDSVKLYLKVALKRFFKIRI